ncbi:hypothetical protein MUY27_07935 [Mucilaginibacter sp. RS28]|uniref:Uncharacterized protein n=1 Tax=Mucilaginibacter straminoryzae TaxID=2932774 RepID=A0A9X1X2G1_9SPHI|nr:hypothetical protein [Mucilaginibacter straminoryzae]MCJ8209636.1 hypothetical protein [Mucilaginibacter straminoryzae]
MINESDAKDQHNYPHHTVQGDDAPAGGYKVEDDGNLTEKDLKRTYIFGDSEPVDADQPGMESHGYGGQNFGESSVTTSGDDPANPSRNAGYDNDYFKRTEPAEEHPELNNFKVKDQQGAPDPDQGGSSTNTEKYQEGTADYDGGTITGGQGEKTSTDNGATSEEADAANNDQHKIGEQNQTEPGKARYDKDYDRGPDYGSNSPDDNKGHIET